MNAPRARASARYRPLKWAPLTMNRVPGVTDWESQETSATGRDSRSADKGWAEESRPCFCRSCQ